MIIKEEILYLNSEIVNSKQLTIQKQHFSPRLDKSRNCIPDKVFEVVNANKVECLKYSYMLNWLGSLTLIY